MIYLTSDHHFGHKNILKFDPKRLKDDGSKFKDIFEHDKYLINKWNSLITNNDIIYYLGDFAYKCSMTYAKYIFHQLNGHKILIKGNHDFRLASKFINCWDNIHEILIIKSINSNGVKQNIILSHRPFLTWEKSCIHFHGHTHGNIEHLNEIVSLPDINNIKILRKDIGVDTNKYLPYLLDNLIN